MRRKETVFELGVGLIGLGGSVLIWNGLPAAGALAVIGAGRRERRKEKAVLEKPPLKKVDIGGRNTRVEYGRVGKLVYEWKFGKK